MHTADPGHKRAFSVNHEQTPLLLSRSKRDDDVEDPDLLRSQVYPAAPAAPSITSNDSKRSVNLFYAAVYAVVNVVISAPGKSSDRNETLQIVNLLETQLPASQTTSTGLYGYAAVIFNHPIFQPHMNALSKLVIFSSLVHQLSFVLFSSMPFAIGTVQDAGLIFLSSMANSIANDMLEEGASQEAVVSTTLVLLSLGTALLGLVLIALGKFKLANAVGYLPMPVVGGVYRMLRLFW